MSVDTLTAEQTAEILGLSLGRVYELVERLDGRKHGRDWLFERKIVEDFAKEDRPAGRPAKDTE